MGSIFTSILAYIFIFVFKKKEVSLAILAVINFVLPDTPEYFHIQSVRRLLLFFIIGIAINRIKIMNKLTPKYYWITLTIVFSIYVCLMIFVLRRGEYFTTQICILTGIRDAIKIVLNTLMQLTGCFSIMLILYKIQPKCKLHVIRQLGENSIVIYVFSGILFFFLIKDYCRIPEEYRYCIKAGYVLVISLIITGISYLTAKLINRNKWTKKILMGK